MCPSQARLPKVSHPTRVRGLKYIYNQIPLVACWSHPTRVRGLKFRYVPFDLFLKTVAPYTGAWIEILKVDYVPMVDMSHPTRVRGLKSQVTFFDGFASASHPTRVRGLKLGMTIADACSDGVAPYTGAWIEIKRL